MVDACSPDIDVKRKVLSIAMEMINSRNVEDVVAFLKKELAKAGDKPENDKVEF